MAYLQGIRQSLADALRSVATEIREAAGALIDKNAAIEAFDEAYTHAATLLSALLILAGEDDLAARVRPQRATHLSTAAVVEEAPAPEEAPPS